MLTFVGHPPDVVSCLIPLTALCCTWPLPCRSPNGARSTERSRTSWIPKRTPAPLTRAAELRNRRVFQQRIVQRRYDEALKAAQGRSQKPTNLVLVEHRGSKPSSLLGLIVMLWRATEGVVAGPHDGGRPGRRSTPSAIQRLHSAELLRRSIARSSSRSPIWTRCSPMERATAKWPTPPVRKPASKGHLPCG